MTVVHDDASAIVSKGWLVSSTARAVVSLNGPRADDCDVATLLGSGGDGRLALDPETGLNRYGCSVLPRPAALSFASSTASSISPRGFARAEEALASWRRLTRSQDEGTALDNKEAELREEFSHLFGLGGSGTDIVFSPSGTDSQLHALALVRAWLGAPLVVIVVAGDETGSGTAFTASGRHFGDRTAQGAAVVPGVGLAGLEGIADAVLVPIAGPGGGARSLAEIDADVIEAVSAAHRTGNKVLVQAMNCSKLGRRCPSDDCLDIIRRRWSGTAQIVVDACQMRLSRGRLRHHLDHGDMVIVTGSKFFSGPAFSGALLVPSCIRKFPVRDLALPPGLGDYTNRQDWPARFKGVRAALPGRVALGSWLRWEAAMAEMAAYFAVPLRSRQQALRMFAEATRGFLDAGARSAMPALDGPPLDQADGEFTTPTIFPFLPHTGGTLVSPERASALYQALNRDMASGLPSASVATASRLCHIGQPVPMTQQGHKTAVLRVSADARFVIDCWSPDSVRCRRLIDDHVEGLGHAFAKLDLLQSIL